MMWFMHLSGRDRAVVVVVGLLALLVFGWLLFWKPVTGYHADERRNYMRAAEDYDFVRQSLAHMPATLSKGANRAGEEKTSLRVAAGQAARSMGLAVTRLQPGDGDSLTLWLDSVDGGLLYQWLARISERHDIRVKNISVSKNEGQGTVRVQVTLMGDGA